MIFNPIVQGGGTDPIFEEPQVEVYDDRIVLTLSQDCKILTGIFLEFSRSNPYSISIFAYPAVSGDDFRVFYYVGGDTGRKTVDILENKVTINSGEYSPTGRTLNASCVSYLPA